MWDDFETGKDSQKKVANTVFPSSGMKIPRYIVQNNVQDQLMATSYIFSVVRDMSDFARRRDDKEIRRVFRHVVWKLSRMGDSLKGDATDLGDKAPKSAMSITSIKDNIIKQFQYSRDLLVIVNDIADFGRSRHTDNELLAVLEASVDTLIDASEVLASSASATGDQLLHSIAG